MSNEQNNPLVITNDNINNVRFDGVELKTTLTTGFDGDVDKDDKVEVDLTFILSGGSEVTEYILDRVASALRITANSPGGVLKGNALDHNTYVEFLAQNKNKFKFSIDDLLPKKQAERTPEETILGLVRAGKITKEQGIAMIDQLG